MSKAGLEGVVVAETRLSHIDGAQGELVYAGYDIDDLARNTTFEEVCYLLWHGRLPTRAAQPWAGMNTIQFCLYLSC